MYTLFLEVSDRFLDSGTQEAQTEKGQVVRKAPANHSDAARDHASGEQTNCTALEYCPDRFQKICSYLRPADLLHIVVTSRRLRSFFLSRRSELTWITARRNHYPTLPECPEAMSEPQYAALLFGPYCQASCDELLRVEHLLRTYDFVSYVVRKRFMQTT